MSTPLPRQLLLSLVLIFLTGCQPNVYLMPTPTGIQSGKHDPFEYTPETEKSSLIAVAFATNRLPSDKGNYYAREFDDTLRMGVTFVQIGDGLQSWEEIRQFSIHGLDKKDARLKVSKAHQMGTMDSDDPPDVVPPKLQKFMNELNNAIDKNYIKEIAVYVHGANNNFERTAAQAAQYQHFTGRQAIVSLFSWPSAESLFRYATDIDNITHTVPTLARYLKLLADHSTAERINIICYSAGATLTTKTLAMLGSDNSQPDREAYRKSLRLGSVYFAAPDTDFDNFIEEYRQYQDIVDRVTVTINQNDSVLGMSRSLFHASGGPKKNNQQVKSSKSRLGKPDLRDLTKEQAKWIIEKTRDPSFDVLEVEYKAIPGLSKGSHNYWYHSPWASTDVLLTLNYHASPEERGLVSSESENEPRIWHFPEDYEARVYRAIDQLDEALERSN